MKTEGFAELNIHCINENSLLCSPVLSPHMVGVVIPDVVYKNRFFERMDDVNVSKLFFHLLLLQKCLGKEDWQQQTHPFQLVL